MGNCSNVFFSMKNSLNPLLKKIGMYYPNYPNYYQDPVGYPNYYQDPTAAVATPSPPHLKSLAFSPNSYSQSKTKKKKKSNNFQNREHLKHLREMDSQVKKVKILANLYEKQNQRQTDLELFQLVAEQEQNSREFRIKIIIFLLPSLFSAGVAYYMVHLDQLKTNFNQTDINAKTLKQLDEQMQLFVEQSNQWFIIGPFIGVLFKVIFLIAFVFINLLVELGVSSILYLKGFLLLGITLSGPVISLFMYLLLQILSKAKLSTPFMTLETSR